MLLAEADSGMYSGSALVIEQMDRLGRLNQHTAREILDRIRKAGLELHITQENRVVRGEFELGAEITNLLRIDEARKYSEKLSERVTKGHRNRRKNAKDGECVTENLPPWLTGKNGEQLKVDEAKAKLVRLP